VSNGRCHGNHFGFLYLSIYGVNIVATWRIRLNHICATAMRPYVKLICSLLSNWLVSSNIGLVYCGTTRGGAMGETWGLLPSLAKFHLEPSSRLSTIQIYSFPPGWEYTGVGGKVKNIFKIILYYMQRSSAALL